MQSYKKSLLLILLALCAQAQCRLIAPLKTFTKELYYQDKRIILSSTPDVVTEYDSFVYAVCDTDKKTFKDNKCNVTVETPAFDNASYIDTCAIEITPANPNLDTLTKLALHPFTDDKLLISWLVKDHDWNTKLAQVRVLYMSNCRFVDVNIQADKIWAIVPYENTFDVLMKGKATCGSASDNCKVTYNAEGKKVNGPTGFLPTVKISRVAQVIASAPRSPIKGLLAVGLTEGNETSLRVLQAGLDGKGGELLKTGSTNVVKLSNANEFLTVCWTSQSTNVSCWQYDAKMNVKFKVGFEFIDNTRFGIVRWIRPHHLQDGGLLLLTGASSGEDNRRFERFSVIKVHPNGTRDRPLEIEGLDFECVNAAEFYVNVAENDDDEFCFNFICERDDFGPKGVNNTLKLSTKCLAKRHAALVKRRMSILN